MTDCVRETLCTHCIHREVCSIKTSYLEVLNNLPRVSTDFILGLSCKYYLKVAPIQRTSTFDTASTISVSNNSEVKGVY